MAIIAVLRNSWRSCSNNAFSGAGWSSLAARRAHNPKVAGSNPAPATSYVFSKLFFKNETTDRGGYWVDWVPGVDVLVYASEVAERLIDKWAGG